MTDVQAIASSYLAAWNEPDPERRHALVTAGWTADGSYADPLVEAHGPERIATMIDGVRAQFPGYHFALRGEPDGHGPFVRFSWSLLSAHGVPIAGGTDVARVDAEKRLVEVVGFLDELGGSASHG